ncbi:hypothetical protein [Cyclobacterium marinum]|uniref:Uncharacterized protein n=1 Tax=Cyclobacterium marinum (strain ATCC 25205 / DSM 745 / LMG 13164 / NCIMB 1802) TaxID=880070 RepID=G0J2U8_CYCMS|nr:hypothetical protein [Cyclobacterium marinum]AEL27435.1 hypothetical protein Cycma_3723 [Cyclobacterium marinum DSM 745]MBI0397211.1 hypothetical protein [Cyclobacterium marinum]MBR9773897.1 hypothetical protein [Cytophagales bacterium]|tara:strand:+ start:61789 stop:62349 length:561 start_codon:yes stop_codon:yes gene_type:complete
MKYPNDGFLPKNIEELKQELKSNNKSFKIIPSEDNTDEYVNFYFIGKYEGKEVIYDAVLYTLKLHYQSELYELAEHEAAKKFPNYQGIKYNEDENGNLIPLKAEEEEIGWFITEMIMDMEEEGAVKVQEFLDLDTHHDYGIGLDAALNLESLDEKAIEDFVEAFNEDSLKLDDTFYTFESEEEEED